jgi:threonine/homoserine/homoserine lactone efflux protein
MTLGSAVVAFALLGALLTVTPGLDTALVLRSAIAGGRGPAFATALGVCAGALIWGAAAAVGVSALLTASEVAYTALRLVGAAYMVFLGGRMIWDAVRRGAKDAAGDEGSAPPTWWGAWAKGLLTNLLNPKVGAFYLAVLPQFIPPGSSHLGVGLLLASVHVLEAMVWFTAIILSAQAFGRFFRRRAVQGTVDGGTGAVLVGVGLKLGLSRG